MTIRYEHQNATPTAIDQPSVIYRPALYTSGTYWCARYGKFPDGVVGVGKSPAEAMDDFNQQWFRKL